MKYEKAVHFLHLPCSVLFVFCLVIVVHRTSSFSVSAFSLSFAHVILKWMRFWSSISVLFIFQLLPYDSLNVFFYCMLSQVLWFSIGVFFLLFIQSSVPIPDLRVVHLYWSIEHLVEQFYTNCEHIYILMQLKWFGTIPIMKMRHS